MNQSTGNPQGLGVAIERVLIGGDLSALSPDQKLSYYNKVCDSLGLNPLTQPFSYIRLNGKEVLYATRACTEQLRTIHKVSLTITSREVMGDVYVVTAQAKTGERCDESTGAVTIKGLAGDNLANAYMKAETKAKRRVTLSICGLGLLDETEVASIHNAIHPKQPEAIKSYNDSIPDEPPYRELPKFIPEVTPKMKAMFEKNETEEIKKQLQSVPTSPPSDFEEPAFPFEEEQIYVNDNTMLMFGKNKGKTFQEIGPEALGKSLWAAEKGLSENADWVGKMGVEHVIQFAKQARAYLKSK